MSTLGQYVQTLRRQAGLTQAQLAQAIGLSGNSLVSRIESGRSLPSAAVISALARFFDRDPETLTAMLADADDTHTTIHSELSAMAQEADRARARLRESAEQLLNEFDEHRETLSHFLVASKLNLVWALPRKLNRERQANTVWVLSPALESETSVPGVRTTVASNLAQGVRYSYLIPDDPVVIERATRLHEELNSPHIEFRLGSATLFAFAVETVIYDAGTTRRLSLMVAPTRRPEFDIVLGAHTASQFEVAFKSGWASAPQLF